MVRWHKGQTLDVMIVAYGWVTSGVPTLAKSQNQFASAGSIPIQP